MKILLMMLVVVSLMSGTVYATENSKCNFEKKCKVTNKQVNCWQGCIKNNNNNHCHYISGAMSQCKLNKKQYDCIADVYLSQACNTP